MTDRAKVRPGCSGRAFLYSLLLSLLFHGVILWRLSARSEFIAEEPVVQSLSLLAFARKADVQPEQWRRQSDGRRSMAETSGLARLQDEIPQARQDRATNESQIDVEIGVAEDDALRFFESLSTPAVYYFALRELDLPPYPLAEITGNIPELQGAQSSGTMEIELWVNDVGQVAKVAILKSDLPENYGAAVERMLKDIPFAPAKRAGASVCARIRFAMSFAPPPLFRRGGR